MALLPRCLQAKEDGCTFHEEAWRDLYHDGGGLIDGSSIRMVEMFTHPELDCSLILKNPSLKVLRPGRIF